MFIRPTFFPLRESRSPMDSPLMWVLLKGSMPMAPLRRIQEKRPWLDGFFPVRNEVHAGVVTGGMTDSSVPFTPSDISLENVGR